VFPIFTLELQCIVQDVIIYVSEWLEQSLHLKTDAETLAPLVKATEQDILSLMAAQYITGEAILEALARTMIMSRDHQDIPIEAGVTIEEEYKEWVAWIQNDAIGNMPSYHKALIVSGAFWQSQIRVTARSYLCLAPGKSQGWRLHPHRLRASDAFRVAQGQHTRRR